jgi:hypothetical protein
LTTVYLGDNYLTNFSLPPGLTNLTTLDLHQNLLTGVSLPAGLTSLTTLDIGNNRVATLTLPPDVTTLNWLYFDANPTNTFVLSEQLAATKLANTVNFLRSQGVAVYTYSLGAGLSLSSPQWEQTGGFGFALTGPPAVYTIFSSPDLAAWSPLGAITNTLGTVVFTDATANSPQKFYHAVAVPQ